jgi:hypothetical protein
LRVLKIQLLEEEEEEEEEENFLDMEKVIPSL